MKLYEVYVPLKYNDGSPVDPRILDRLGARLLEAFGGYTFNPQPHRGVWRMGDVTFRDEIVIFRVLTGKARLAARCFKQLRRDLERELHQEKILILSYQAEIS